MNRAVSLFLSLAPLWVVACASTTSPEPRAAQESDRRAPARAPHVRSTGARLWIPEEYRDELEWDAAAFENVPNHFDKEVHESPASRQDQNFVRESRKRSRASGGGGRRGRRGLAKRGFKTTGVSVSVTPASGHPTGLPGHATGRPGHAVNRSGQPVSRPGQAIGVPKHAFSRPSHSVGIPGFPVTRPAHPMALPGKPVGLPGHAVRRPNPPVGKSGHPVHRSGHPVQPVPGTKKRSTSR